MSGDLLSLIQTEPDYRNGTCGWCVRALVSGVLPDGRPHYFCAAFPGCMKDSRRDQQRREQRRAAALTQIRAAASDPTEEER